MHGINTLNIYQTFIQGNQAYRGAVYMGRNQANLNMEGNLIINNKQDDSVDTAISLFATEDLMVTEINYTTIAKNKVHRISHNDSAIENSDADTLIGR